MTGTLGMMLGLAYIASPGPVNIETLRRGLSGGFRVALALQCGALVGRLVWALLALIGADLLLAPAGAQTMLGIVGSVLLLYLGCSTLQSRQVLATVACALEGVPRDVAPRTPTTRRTAWIGVAIALANPLAPVFWLSVVGMIGSRSQQHPAIFLGGFVLGALLASVAIALLVGLWHRCLTPRLVRVATSSCGLALIGCGLFVGYTTVLG